MTIDALKVVYAQDSSHILIRCNRLLGKAPTPECTWVTTTTSTTTTTTTTTTTITTLRTPTTSLISEAVINDGHEAANKNGHVGEIIGGVISGILAIVAIILLILFLKQRQKHHDVENANQNKKEIQEEKIPLANGGEDSQAAQKVALLPAASKSTSVEAGTGEDTFVLGEEVDIEDDSSRPRFSSPIWLQEIHSNKIFNRQKSLLSEDKLKNLVEEEPLPPPPPLPEEHELVVNGDDSGHDNDDEDDIVGVPPPYYDDQV